MKNLKSKGSYRVEHEENTQASDKTNLDLNMNCATVIEVCVHFYLLFFQITGVE